MLPRVKLISRKTNQILKLKLLLFKNIYFHVVLVIQYTKPS